MSLRGAFAATLVPTALWGRSNPLLQEETSSPLGVALFGHLIVASSHSAALRGLCAGALIAALCCDIVRAPRSESGVLPCCMARIET